MGYITINGKKVEFTDEKNVLSIIRKAGIDIPTLCYHSELSTFGACRLCTVEDDRGRLFASCSEEPRDGMVIYTHTERLRKHRKLIVELLKHPCCERVPVIYIRRSLHMLYNLCSELQVKVQRSVYGVYEVFLYVCR